MAVIAVRLLLPLLPAIQAPNEDRHRLICRSRLELIVRAHLLLTLRAAETIRRHGQVTLQDTLLTSELLVLQVLPMRRLEFIW